MFLMLPRSGFSSVLVVVPTPQRPPRNAVAVSSLSMDCFRSEMDSPSLAERKMDIDIIGSELPSAFLNQ